MFVYSRLEKRIELSSLVVPVRLARGRPRNAEGFQTMDAIAESPNVGQMYAAIHVLRSSFASLRTSVKNSASERVMISLGRRRQRWKWLGFCVETVYISPIWLAIDSGQPG